MSSEKQRVLLPGGELWSYPGAFARQADDWLRALLDKVAWRSEKLHLFGRWVEAPRRIAWYGDPGAEYCYSGRRHVPRPWIVPLREMRTAVQKLLGASFNSALLNLYRDGNDAMGWHSDDEPELQPRPLIASLSFGATRRFDLRPRGGGAIVSLQLEHGSLLVMGGDTQRHWRHRVPRSARCQAPRVNVTFRRVRGVRA